MIITLPRCVPVPNQTWEGVLQGLCLSAQRAPKLSALGLGDLVEVTEERCVDKLDSTDRTVGLLHPYLANGCGPGAAGGCWLPTGAQQLVVIGQTPELAMSWFIGPPVDAFLLPAYSPHNIRDHFGPQNEERGGPGQVLFALDPSDLPPAVLQPIILQLFFRKGASLPHLLKEIRVHS